MSDEAEANAPVSDLRAVVRQLGTLSRADLDWLRLTAIPEVLRRRTRAVEVGWPPPVPFVDEVQKAQAALDEAIARAARMAEG